MTDARRSIITMRVTPLQKKRIQGKAKRARESVSTFLLRCVEAAGELPPRQGEKVEGGTIRICLAYEATAPQETPEATAERQNCFELSEEAAKLAE